MSGEDRTFTYGSASGPRERIGANATVWRGGENAGQSDDNSAPQGQVIKRHETPVMGFLCPLLLLSPQGNVGRSISIPLVLSEAKNMQDEESEPHKNPRLRNGMIPTPPEGNGSLLDYTQPKFSHLDF
jgi:hypothetical protein